MPKRIQKNNILCKIAITGILFLPLVLNLVIIKAATEIKQPSYQIGLSNNKDQQLFEKISKNINAVKKTGKLYRHEAIVNLYLVAKGARLAYSCYPPGDAEEPPLPQYVALVNQAISVAKELNLEISKRDPSGTGVLISNRPLLAEMPYYQKLGYPCDLADIPRQSKSIKDIAIDFTARFRGEEYSITGFRAYSTLEGLHDHIGRMREDFLLALQEIDPGWSVGVTIR